MATIIIPANPGFYTNLESVWSLTKHDEDLEFLDFQPVVAWRISENEDEPAGATIEYYPRPITVFESVFGEDFVIRHNFGDECPPRYYWPFQDWSGTDTAELCRFVVSIREHRRRNEEEAKKARAQLEAVLLESGI